MPDQHHYQRILRLGFLRDAIEHGADAVACGCRSVERFHFGVGSRFESLVDVLGPAAEALLVLGLATQAADGDVISGRLESRGAN